MKQKFPLLFFYILPILLILNLLLRFKLTLTTSPDSYDYFKISEALPKIITSMWPFLYSLFLKITNTAVNDYLISSKIISLLSLSFIIIFVKIKNFYWKEIWTLLCFFSFQRLFPLSLSEVIFVPLSFLLFFYNYQFLTQKLSSKKFIIYNSLLLILLFVTKYSGLFIILSFILFTVYLKISRRLYFSTYFRSLFIALSVVTIYLICNKFITGYFMGLRTPPDINGYHNIRLSLSQIFFNLNPFFHTRIDNFMGLFSISWNQAYLFSFISTILWGTILIKNLKNKPNLIDLKVLLLACSSFFLVGTVYSYFTTKVDILDFRLLVGYYTFLFFAIIISISQKKVRQYDLILIIIGLFAIIPQLINLIVKEKSFC